MKYVVVILDGAAGWPLSSLGGKTTLARAETPNLDALAAEGLVGLAQTVPPGAEPSSAAACTSILGYDPIADAVGRGAIEAASMGIQLAPDEVALRMNLVTILRGVMASYAGGHITTAESQPIVAALQDALGSDTLRFYPGVAYRHIMVVKGRPELTDARYTPPHDISDQPVAQHLPSDEMLRDLMLAAHDVLENVPQNAVRREQGRMPVTDIWPFWPGMAPKGMRPFAEVRGLTAAMTSGVDLLNGLATLTGLDRLEIPGVTDGSDNDYAAQTIGGLAALAGHDLVVIHVESPDEEGHAGDAERKVAAIEDIDREVIGRVREAMGAQEMRVLAMPDHPTPISRKTHVGEPVPFVIAGSGVDPNGALRYDESSAEATGLTVDPGRGVMDLLLG